VFIFLPEGHRKSTHLCNACPPCAARLDPGSPGHLLTSRDNAPQGVNGRGTALQDGFFYALIHKT